MVQYFLVGVFFEVNFVDEFWFGLVMFFMFGYFFVEDGVVVFQFFVEVVEVCF